MQFFLNIGDLDQTSKIKNIKIWIYDVGRPILQGNNLHINVTYQSSPHIYYVHLTVLISIYNEGSKLGP